MNAQRILLEFTRADRADDPHAFDFRAQEYLLRTEGGGVRSAVFTWSDPLLDDLDAVRAPDCDPAVIQRVGLMLRRFLAAADFARYEQVLERAVDVGQTVHLTIRSAAAELYVLPWELLVVGASGRHLGALPNVLVRYAWPETVSTSAVEPRAEGGRIVLAWSAAGGPVPAAEHQAAIERACTRSAYPFEPGRDILAEVSPQRLSQALSRTGPGGAAPCVLHLLCHGAATGQNFGLVMSDESGRRAVVDAGRLRELLAPHAAQLRLVVLCACDSGNSGDIGNHLGSVAQNLHSAGIQAVVASRFPLSVRGSTLLAERLYGALLGRPASLEQAFLAARTQLARDPSNRDWASVQLYARPEDGDDTRPLIMRPYRGLLPFRTEHARFFFGRDAESAEILSDMEALAGFGRDAEAREIAADLRGLAGAGKPRFLVVAGASGTGKSSVVMAGAVPKLLGAADLDRSEAVDVNRVMQTLSMLQDKVASDEVRRGIEMVRRGLTGPGAIERSDGAWEIAVMRVGRDPLRGLDAVLAGRRDPSRPFLLVVDQFEELFTSIDNPELRQSFVRQLWSLGRGTSGVYCVVTMRVDFLGQCGEIVLDESGLRLDQVAYDEAHRVFVAQMDPDQLRQAIEEPARLVGLELEPGLASTMLGDVGAEPGALPLLQYILDLLWQRRVGRTLTAAAYHELGGVTGALQRRADALIDSFTAREQALARRMLVRLVGAQDDDSAQNTRRRAAIESLRPIAAADQAGFDRVLDALVAARLLVRSDDRGTPTIEVAHEALIRKWPRLREWLLQDRDKLVELQEIEAWTEQWKTYGTLLDGAQLGYAERVRDKFPDDLDPATSEMIAASVRTARRGRLLRRAIFAGGMALTALAVVAGAFAVVEAGRANQAADEVSAQAAVLERQRDDLARSEAQLRATNDEVAAKNEELEQNKTELEARQAALERSQAAIEEQNDKLAAALERGNAEQRKALRQARRARKAAE
ncbi:MAG: CHAT domain-containing protein, partial [Myxococcota bacterium]